MRRRREYTPEIKEKVLELRKQGMTKRQIAKKLDIPPGTIGRWISGINPVAPKPTSKHEQLRQEARQLKREGWSAYQIARKFGISLSTVFSWTKGVALPYKRGDRKKAYNMWLNGADSQQIAQKLNLSRDLVDKWVDDFEDGYSPLEKGYTDEEVAEMMKDYRKVIKECEKRGWM